MSNKFAVTGNGEHFVVDLEDVRVVQTPEMPIVIQASAVPAYEKAAAEIYGEVPFRSPLPDDLPMPITMPHGGLPDFRYTPPSGKEHRRNRRAAARRSTKKKNRNK